MSVFCGCFKNNNTHVAGNNKPGTNPNRESRQRNSALGRPENNLLEMNKRGALGDADYNMETDGFGNASAGERSGSPHRNGARSITNGTYSNAMTNSRFDDTKVSSID